MVKSALTNKIAVLLLLFSGLISCEPSPYYEQYLPVSNLGWHKDSAATFAVDIKEANVPYAIIFNLRANDDYPYSNLYLFREITSEAGVEYTDTAMLTLADSYGRWLGQGIGELKTYSRPYRAQPLSFRQPGIYNFTFTQAMRTTQLAGVEAVGLTLYKQPNTEAKNASTQNP